MYSCVLCVLLFWRRDGVEIWDFTFLTLTRSCSIEFHHCTLVYFFKNLCPQRWAHDFFLFALYWCLSFSKRPIGLHYRLAWSDFFSLCQSKFVPQVKKVKLLRQKRCGLLKEMFDHCDRLPWANSIFCVRSAMIRKSSSLSLLRLR